MERRSVIGGGLMAGAAGFLSAAPAAAATSADDAAAVVSALNAIRSLFEQEFDSCNLGRCPHIDTIRRQQRTFMKATQKYPDFIEVGPDVWESVYDWHVKHQQPLQAARTSDGRYVITFMFTNLILRPEQDGNYVGYGFDSAPPR